MAAAEAPVEHLDAASYVVPTESFGETVAESDGTARWDSTGVVVVELEAAGQRGLGYAYGAPAALDIIRSTLAECVIGTDALDSTGTYWAMARALRNTGWGGVTATALSAIDVALHDLRGRILDVSLVRLLGGAQEEVEAYGSGGFTSYSIPHLQQQLGGWAADGFRAVKMKVGTHPASDLERVRAAREAVGDDVELFVDANGAYGRAQALRFAEQYADLGVTWFEEPVSSDDLDGLRLLRDRAPGGMRIAAGEYGYTPAYFARMLAAGAVHVLQADATRCGGPTGFLLAAALAVSTGVPSSAHTAPAIHASVACAAEGAINVEYFHDHARIEGMFFDGAVPVSGGMLRPDRGAPGLGLAFRQADAEPYLQARVSLPG
jgi:L-alanine-DL-glutamate epimerase-like enolase superfamily enzyme